MIENSLLHVLPWLTIILAILYIVFMIWLVYYTYEGTKLQNPRKTQSVVTMIFVILFGIVAGGLFIWALIHFELMSSKKKKEEKEKMSYSMTQQDVSVAQARPVQNLNSVSSSSNAFGDNTSASTPLNVGRNRVSYSGDIFDSAQEATNIKNLMSS